MSEFKMETAGELPCGYTLEDVSQYDGGPRAWSFGRPDGTLDDDAYDAIEDATDAAWQDFAAELPPFQQGTLTAASEEASRVLGRQIGFKDWSGEALSRVKEDCGRARAAHMLENTPESGRSYWTLRQAGRLANFPPLVISLSDGKVELKEAGQ